MNAIPPPASRAPAFLTIGFNGRDGGYTTLAWGITDESAHELIAEFRDRAGEPDVETTASEEGVMALGRAHLENAVVMRREVSGE
jgi:hypothetical protein